MRVEGEQRQQRPPGLGISDLNIELFMVSQSGRPLSERKSYSDVQKLQVAKGINMDSATSRLQDSRRGRDKLVNNAALEAMTRGENKQKLFNTLSWINDKIFGGEQPEVLSTSRILELSQIAEALPAYLALRAKDPVPVDALPDEVSNAFKIGLGIRQIVQKRNADGVIDRITTPNDLYTFADDNGLFRDAEDRDHNCPAPQRLIEQTVDAFVFGNGGKPEESILETLIADGDHDHEMGDLVGFSNVYAAYRNAVRGYKAGLYSPGLLIKTFPQMQDNMNLFLGRDPSTAPKVVNNDILRMAFAEGFVVSPGGMVDQARTEVRDALDELPVTRVETLELKPMQRRERKGMTGKGKKGKKGKPTRAKDTFDTEPTVGRQQSLAETEDGPRVNLPSSGTIFHKRK